MIVFIDNPSVSDPDWLHRREPDVAEFGFNPGQPRDDQGQWTDGGGYDDDYHAGHRPTDTGPRAHDLLESEVVPTDVYDNPQWYSGYDSKGIRETMRQLRAVRGNPDGEVTIYRAAPDVANPIRPGDWVSLSRSYAQQHVDSQSREDHELSIHELVVPAAAVRWAVDDLMEFGYFPDGVDELREMAATTVTMAFNPGQPRDPDGRWTSGAGGDYATEDAAWEAKQGQTRRDGKGNCFRAAVDVLMDMSTEERDRSWLVHGVATGQGEIDGVKFDHAWVETAIPLPDGLSDEQRALFEQHGLNINVIDRSNGLDVNMPRSLYYSVGRIDRSTVHRYTAEEMLKHMAETMHYGPWDF